jgi:Xaa-Pro dipeptidase
MAQLLDDMGLDAFFATSPVTMGYLAGLHEGGGERFLMLAVNAKGETRFICPGLSATQARRSGMQDVRPWNDGEDPLVHVRQLAEDWNLRSGIVAVEDDMRAQMLLWMQKELPAALFKPGQEVIAGLMGRKEPEEIESLRQAGEIADKALAVAIQAMRPGVTEREIAAKLVAEMTRMGGGPGFCIIAAGSNGAEPHHGTDDTVIKEGDVVVMDYGCSINGYPSDITRTISCGKASPEAHKVYKIVYDAFMAGRNAAKAGVACEEVDRAARKVIDAAGYGEYFMHRVGHGIGMRGHEDPYMIEGNKLPLATGHCFSVEPGVYLPGNLGVRIENIVTITESGCLSLNAEPSATLIEAGSQ